MAFHSYTRLIQKLFNAYWFGPPSRVTGTSPWPSVDHLVSRLPTPTQRPIQARSHCGCARPRAYPRRRGQLVGSLCKRHAVTRTRRAPTACGRMVSGSVSTSSAECFSPFPHGTGTLSVSRECLALPDGPGGFRRDYTCPALLRMPRGEGGLRLRGYHPLRRRFPGGLASSLYRRKRGPTTPGTPEDGPRFGLLPFRSPLLGESLDYFLFLRVLRCFSSPRSPPPQKGGYRQSRWVVPFGDPRIKGHLRLPADYRSLSRPSSPPRAKASAMRPRITSSPPAQKAGGGQLAFLPVQIVKDRSPEQNSAGRERAAARPLPPEGSHMDRKGRPLQKGGVPAAPSGTATLLRLSPNHRYRPRPTLAVTDFRRPRLSWLDGRCVQGPGTYSPRHG